MFHCVGAVLLLLLLLLLTKLRWRCTPLANGALRVRGQLRQGAGAVGWGEGLCRERRERASAVTGSSAGAAMEVARPGTANLAGRRRSNLFLTMCASTL